MKSLWWTIPIIGLLSGCATSSQESMPQNYAGPTGAAPRVLGIPNKVVRLSGLGYGNMGSAEGYTPGQKRLMAMRAAKLDAYRSLAEQVHGVRVTGNSTVAAMVAQNDSFRVYVDAYVRGAKVVSITPMAENNYETILELELGSDFFEFFNSRTMPAMAQATLSSNYAGRGAVGAGSSYSSNFNYYNE